MTDRVAKHLSQIGHIVSQAEQTADISVSQVQRPRREPGTRLRPIQDFLSRKTTPAEQDTHKQRAAELMAKINFNF